MNLRNLNYLMLILGSLLCFKLSAKVEVKDSEWISCQKFFETSEFVDVKKSLKENFPKLQTNSDLCQIVIAKTLFPKRNNKGVVSPSIGLQISLYQNNTLSLICIPGESKMVCKKW